MQVMVRALTLGVIFEMCKNINTLTNIISQIAIAIAIELLLPLLTLTNLKLCFFVFHFHSYRTVLIKKEI